MFGAEYAKIHEDSQVILVDIFPQANLSEDRSSARAVKDIAELLYGFISFHQFTNP